MAATVEEIRLLQKCVEAGREPKVPSPPGSCLFPGGGTQPETGRQESRFSGLAFGGTELCREVEMYLRAVNGAKQNVFI